MTIFKCAYLKSIYTDTLIYDKIIIGLQMRQNRDFSILNIRMKHANQQNRAASCLSNETDK